MPYFHTGRQEGRMQLLQLYVPYICVSRYLLTSW
jgi:hypothetical protein